MRYKLKIIIPAVVLAAMLLSMAPIVAPAAHAVEPGVTTGPTLAQAGKSDSADTKITCNAIDTCILFLVYWAGPGIAGGVAYIGAYFFSIVVQLSLNSTAYALDFLSTGWTTVRDIANMAFIFILIYIALTVMLAAETSGTIKTLAVVIVIALLVNFSFFFTRVVIDAGNIVAVQFYNAIPNVGPLIGDPVTGAKDLSLSIMGAINPQELLNSQMLDRARKMAQGDWGGMAVLSVIYISVAAIFWILFFAFLQVGIKFMMRIVGLWFVLIASPLAFVAKTMKQTSHFFDQWLGYLIKFSFYPAIFLFMFWILTKFTTSILSSGGNGTIMGALYTAPTSAAAEVSTMAVIATIMIRMGFVVAVLYVGLKVSDWIVKEGSSVASKITGWSTGKAFGSGASVLGWGGRKSFGMMGNALGQSAMLNRMIDRAERTGVNAKLWGGIGRAAKGLGSASYDIRNAPGGGLVKKVFEKGVGSSIGTGKATAEGFTEQAKAQKEKNEKEKQNRAAIIRDAANKDALKRIAGEVKSGTAHDPKDVDRIKNLSKRETESIKAANLENVAHIITAAQLKTVSDSDKFTDDEKEKLRLVWNEKSGDAPLMKAQKVLANELRPLVTSMTAAGIHLGTVAANTAVGHTMDSAGITAMKNELNTKIADLRSDIRSAAPGANTSGLQKNLAILQNGIKGVEKLDDERKKVPANVGGHTDDGKFTVA